MKKTREIDNQKSGWGIRGTKAGTALLASFTMIISMVSAFIASTGADLVAPAEAAPAVVLANPPLNGGCGQNVAIVADLSGSMDPGNASSPTATSLYQLKQATYAYVDELAGSNSKIALFTFGTYSPNIDPANPTGVTRYNGNHPLTSVQTDAGAQQVKDWISNWRGWGWTRWDLGLQAVANSGEHYDYILFVTDGYPTDDHGNTVTATSTPNIDTLVTSANAVKADGTRIIVIYAPTGNQTLNAEQRANVQAISGPTHGQSVLVNDYYETDWSAVVQQFQTLANMCSLLNNVDATRTIHYVDEDGNTMAADVVQHVSYVKTTDLNTNAVTYDPPLASLYFDSVTSPVVAGYTPDQSSVAREAVPVTADPPNLEETVTYTRNVVDYQNSSWTVAPTTSVAGETVPYANGNSTHSDYWTATLTAKNQFGVAMDDLDTSLISFSVDPSASVTISPVTNNHDGTYSVTIASTKAGDYTASLKYNGQPVGDPQTISFQSGTLSYTKSTFTVDPVADPADKSTWVTVSTGENYYTATLTAKDDNDNPLTDLNTADITFSANPSAKVTITDVVNNHDGTYTVHYSSTLADTTSPTKMAQVTYKDPTTGAPTAVGTPKPIPFKAGDDSVNPVCDDPAQIGTSLSVDNNTVAVGGVSHATALVTDQYCNVKEDVNVTFSLDPALSGGLSTTTAKTDQYGKAYTDVTDNVAETVTLHATIPAGEIKPAQDITFTEGSLSYTKSTFTVDPVANPADKSTWVTVSTGENYYTATLTAMDENENPLKDLKESDIAFSVNPSAKVTITDVVNNHDGTYTVHYSSTLADTTSPTKMAQVTYQGQPVGSAKPIPFKAGDDSVNPVCDDPAQIGTSLSVDNNTVAVGGVSHATALVTDQYCNAKEGVDVVFTLNPALSGGLVNVHGTTGSDGKAYADVTDNVAETVTLHATIPAGEIKPAQDVTFTEGGLDTVNSIFTVRITDPTATVVAADGTQSWTGTLTAQDGKGNLLSDLNTADMAFTVSSTDVTVSSVANKGNGVYEVTYTSTTAGDYTAALTYKGNKVGANEQISFVAGPVDDKYSTVSVDPPRQAAGSMVTVTVTARDVNNNPVSGLNASDVVVVGTSAGLPNLAISNFTRLDNGVYTYQATSRLVGEFEVRATVTGTLLSEAPHVVFYAGGVCVNGADPVVPGNVTRFDPVVPESMANGVDQDSAKAYAFDCNGNPVPNASVDVVDMSTGELAGFLNPAHQTVTTGDDGTVMVYWTSAKAGTFTAEGTIGGLRPTTGVMRWIKFTNGLGDPDKSDLVVTPQSPIQVENSYTATVTVRDATGNPVPEANVSFSLDPSTPATLSDSFCTTVSDGTCWVKVSSDLATTVSIHATLLKNGTNTDLSGNGEAAKASPQTVSFIAGPVCVTNCSPVDPTHITRVEVTTDGAQANGQAQDVAKAYAYDNKGNPKQGITVASSTSDSALGTQTIATTNADGMTEIDYTSTVAGPHMAFVTIDSKVPPQAISSDGNRTDGRITLNFGSGTASAQDSYLTIDPTTSQQVDSQFIVTAHVVDTNKNAVSGAVVSFPAVDNLTFNKTSCTSEADGTCQVSVTSRLVGTYTVSAKLGADNLKNTVDAVFTAGPVCVPSVDVCDPVNPDNVTRVRVTTDGQTADGVAHDIATVWAYDHDGNPVQGVVVQSAPHAGETALTVQSNVASTGADGTTTIWYASTVKGGHQADVTIGGKTPAASPITVSFGSGAGDVDHSSWVVAPKGTLPAPLTVGQGDDSTYTATATVNDANNNPVQDATVVFSIDPSGAPVFTPRNTCQTNSQGQCSVNVYSTRSGTYSMQAKINDKSVTNADTHEVSAPVAWKADAVCSQAENCNPVDPTLPNELRTRVEIVDNNKAADGVAQDTVNVWAFDKWGNPVEGALVQSTTDDTMLGIRAAIPSINKDGSSLVWYTSTVAGDHTAAVLVDGVRPVNSPVTLTFVSGDLDSAHSTFTVSRTDPSASVVVADGVQSWTGKLVAADRNGNSLSNLDVANMAFTAAPAGVTVSSVANKGGGVYEVTYTSLTSGDYTAALTYKSQKVGSDEPISFVSGQVDDKYSTVSVDPNRQVAGSPVTVTITARDVNNNPITGLNASDIVVAGKAAGLPDLTTTGFTRLDNGVYTYQATSQVIGEFEVRATVTGTLLSEAPHVTFYSGGVCVNNATPVNPANVTRFDPVVQVSVANGTDKDSAKAYAYDCLGNPVQGATVLVEDKSTGELAGFLNPQQQSVTTGADGTAMVYWTSTKAGTFTAEGTIDGLRPVTGVMSWITFNSGLGDPGTSELVVTPASPIVVENAYTATVTVRDSNGNAVPNEAVSFSLDPSTPATLSATTCSTGPDGTCWVKVSSDLVTTVAIHATLPKNGQLTDLGGNGQAVKASPQTVSFVAGPVCVVDCHPVDPTHVTRVEVDVDGSQANGQAQDVATAWAYDNKGNPVPDKAVTSSASDSALGIQVVGRTGANGSAEIDYTSTVAGPHMAFVTVDSRTPVEAVSSDGTRTDGRITLNFGSGTASAQDSYLTISPVTSQQVNSTFTVTAHVLDVNKNAVSDSVVSFPPVANLTFNKTSCTSEADGTCQVSVTSRLVGTYTVRGQLSNLQNLSNTVDAVFTAGPVCVPSVDVCDPVNPDNVTRVRVTTDGQTADGVAHDIATVWAYDHDGNPVQGVVVQSAPHAGETALTVQSNVASTGADGTTTIWYASTVKGGHQADVTIGGKTPAASPIRVSFGSGAGDVDHSSWVVTPAGPLTVGQGASSTYTATATVRDKTNNPVQDATVVFTIDPSAPVFTQGNTCQTNEQGVCSVSVYSTKSGTYSMAASITAGPVKNADTSEISAPIAWKADAVCSHVEGCDPVDPTLPAELRTHVDITANNQTADGVAHDVVTVWAFDQWGNPVEGALVQSTSGNAAMSVQTGIASINKAGSSTIWYASMTAGTYPASILVDGKKAVDPQVQLTFVAGPVCVIEAGCEPVGPGTDPSRQTRVAVTLNDQVVNGSDIVTVYAFDKTGNVVPGVQFDIRTADTTLSFATGTRSPQVTSGANNTVAATSTTGGSHAASASVDGTELINHGSPMDLRFLGAPAITSPKNGDLTNDKPVVITGTGQTPGDVIHVTDGPNPVCQAQVLDDLTWTCQAALTDGDHTLVAVQTNPDGVNSPESAPVRITVDTTAPTPPEVGPSNGSKVTGKTDPGTTVTVTDPNGNPVQGCVDVVPDQDGNFSCTPATPLPPNTTVKVTAKDPAGNVSAPTTLTIVALRIEFAYESRQPGQDQVVTGYNFNPNEQVCLFLGEIKMDCQSADEKGTVTITFTVPSSTPSGTQTVTLTGASSGSVSGSFAVSAIQVKTGGTASPRHNLGALAVGCLLAAAGVWGITRRVAAVPKK